MRRPIVLAIPTLNEEASIGPLLGAVPRDVVDQIIVADGGSTDATIALARAAGATVIEAGRGYGRACLKASEAAPGDAIMVFMDGDGADDPAMIAALVAPIQAGAQDFVIGSRVTGTREPGSMGWHQVSAGIAAGLAMRALYAVRYTDMCAFRAIGRDMLFGLAMQEMTYGWNLEMQMKVARNRLRVLEIPVPNRCRTGGKSKVAGSVRGTLRAGSRIVATFVRVARERETALSPQEAKS
ncbi:glycosyltransferase family 2 protein [Beijerinckia sp. L45]|uniref:glycosyltransferase family 2 protein n=1 Tax=Beijerinckia sp. L45 TaxID=1641855 RepID=UPI001FEF1DD1|nr:glycosyltransferase family 2 protein [Beijerinckia sp. L45]